MTPIVFLDFDGVLLTRESMGYDVPMSLERDYGREYAEAQTFDPKCVKSLNTFIEASGADVVISSGWRWSRSIEQLRTVLSCAKVRCNVIGMTPSIANDPCRGWEIEWWLKDHCKNVPKFVIIDDRDDMGRLRIFLAQTNMESGFTEKTALEALQILHQQ